MTNKLKIWLLVAVALVVGIVGGIFSQRLTSEPLGASLGLGHIEVVRWIFARGANFGGSEQTTIDNAGNLTTSGATSLTGTLTQTAASTLGQVTLGGTAEAQTLVATSTLAASTICNDSFLSITPVSSTPTITLPSTTTLFASCLGTKGQSRTIVFQAITTSTILAAGAGGTILNSSSLTIAAGKAAILQIIHDTATSGGTYLVMLVNLVN